MEYVLIGIVVLVFFFLNYFIRTKASVSANRYYNVAVIALLVIMLVASFIRKDYGFLPVALICGYSLYKRFYPAASRNN